MLGKTMPELWAGWMAPFLLGDAIKAVIAALLVTVILLSPSTVANAIATAKADTTIRMPSLRMVLVSSHAVPSVRHHRCRKYSGLSAGYPAPSSAY